MTQSVAFINPKLTSKNVGDFFIENGAKQIVQYDPASSIDIDPRCPLTKSDIEKINACQVAVIAGTNLWYSSVEKDGRWMISADDIKKIKIPIVPLGVGTTVHRGQTVKFDKQSQYLLELIHASCNEASVRDPVTYELMRQSSINNVRMTGCPTLYSSLNSQWQLNKKPSDHVVLTVRKGQNRNVKAVIAELLKQSKHLTIAAQKKQDLFCAGGKFPFFSKKTDYLYEFNLKPYQDMVSDAYGAIGWRLHGNMFHLAAGNPVRFFANCSRVRSFCEAFSLPYIYAEDGEHISKHELASAVDMFLNDHDYSRFQEKYVFYFNEMKDFLLKNNINNNL